MPSDVVERAFFHRDNVILDYSPERSSLSCRHCDGQCSHSPSRKKPQFRPQKTPKNPSFFPPKKGPNATKTPQKLTKNCISRAKSAFFPFRAELTTGGGGANRKFSRPDVNPPPSIALNFQQPGGGGNTYISNISPPSNPFSLPFAFRSPRFSHFSTQNPAQKIFFFLFVKKTPDFAFFDQKNPSCV